MVQHEMNLCIGNRQLSTDDCHDLLRAYIERCVYVDYDHDAGYAYRRFEASRLSFGRLSRDRLAQIYRAMLEQHRQEDELSRMWEGHVDRDPPFPELEKIPPTLDLIQSPQKDVSEGWDALDPLLDHLTARTGLGDVPVTKVLHVFRPRFIAISDRHVKKVLRVEENNPYKVKALEVQWGLRALGRDPQNLDMLDALDEYVHELPKLFPIRTDDDEVKSAREPISIDLSKARILDILLYSDAIRAKLFCWPRQYSFKECGG